MSPWRPGLCIARAALSTASSAGAALAAWPPDGRGLCVAAGDQIWPQLAPDGTGGAIIAWMDLRHDLGCDVYARRVKGDGEPAPDWPGDGLALATGPGYQQAPRLLSDGEGGAFVVWQDGGNPGYTIQLQRVTASGAVVAGWPAEGLVACGGLSTVYDPQMVSDGAGGVFVAWTDGRNYYARGVRASGQVASGWSSGGDRISPAAGWPHGGLTVARDRPLAGGKDELALSPDGASGAFFTWTDARDYPAWGTEIYAQHLDATGSVVLGWEPDGIAIARAPGDQTNGGLVPDGAGGAVAAWFDGRQGNDDVYTQRLNASGPAVSGRFSVLAAAPNPTREASTILFQLPATARVNAAVFDATGHRVRTLAGGREFGAGRRSLTWDGRRDDGAAARAGLYFVRLEAGALTARVKIARVR